MIPLIAGIIAGYLAFGHVIPYAAAYLVPVDFYQRLIMVMVDIVIIVMLWAMAQAVLEAFAIAFGLKKPPPIIPPKIG